MVEARVYLQCTSQCELCVCVLQAYMDGLGLWGEGLPFRNFDSFLESVTRRGLGAAEMLTMEMKSAGMYVSRGLSYRQTEVLAVLIYVYVCTCTCISYMYIVNLLIHDMSLQESYGLSTACYILATHF